MEVHGKLTMQLPLILAGGSKLGLNHGKYTVFDEKHERLSNLYLSMLHKLDIEKESFLIAGKLHLYNLDPFKIYFLNVVNLNDREVNFHTGSKIVDGKL